MNIKEKLEALRALMAEQGVDGYLVPRADEYQGEFVAPYAERLKWLTEFTGSAGLAIVLADKAVVMSDGRYTLQLDNQVDPECFKTANSVKIKPEDWLNENAGEGATIGYDPMLHTPAQIETLEKKNNTLKLISQNLIDQIWCDQPSAPTGKISVFSQEVAGQSSSEKINNVKEAIRSKDAQACLITLPDSLCWLLNIRGSDIDYIPSVLSRLIVFADDRPAQWFVDEEKLTPEVRAHLENVEIIPPAQLDAALASLDGPIMMDFKRTPIAFKSENAVDEKDPCIQPKALKTPSEIEAIKKAHVVDGVAVTKFLHWLAYLDSPVTEQDTEAKILELRQTHPAFRGASFPTIAGFGENGAIIHYRASAESNTTLEEGRLLLVDSGGQYYDGGIAGTTDITRTVAIGAPSQAMRESYTRVLKGHIGLAAARFPKTATGAQVDVFARAPLWEAGLDYAHGTGHGVGCYLAVHEEATGLSPRSTQKFEAGMLISNEPGYYEPGAYGIRIESLVLVKEDNDVENMLCFETIGYAPFDHKLICSEMLSPREKLWLDVYYETIRTLILPQLDQATAIWLESELKAID